MDTILEAPCPTTVLYPRTGGNLHCFTAVASCAVLDVLAPTHCEADGRSCTYYHDYHYSAFSNRRYPTDPEIETRRVRCRCCLLQHYPHRRGRSSMGSWQYSSNLKQVLMNQRTSGCRSAGCWSARSRSFLQEAGKEMDPSYQRQS